ncbi:hypothetical protein H0I23_15120 [Cellulophaga sp. HaHaR_3_176]|uniref:hypothetical protein n=1 Tax=Cellulophaga sp. HaHaR_3_176 TaxID=1942464 RepID=UPI001C1F9112|nr:hypothetical protein [Cellulophaga sp. HaHaR_3_176]QWX83764.1 hypothetical protein H0I23_15120 [Cellulophaga sp. HaHaR_3_176]
MSIQDLILWFNTNRTYVLYYFAIALILAVICNLILKPKNVNSIKYIMSAIVYGVCIPGLLAFFLLLYNILFLRQNILELSLVTYFLPIIAMVSVIIILNKKVKMSRLPGFTKLSSLMVMISIAFFILFILQRSHFGVLILGGFTQLLLVFGVILVILRVAWAKFVK